MKKNAESLTELILQKLLYPTTTLQEVVSLISTDQKLCQRLLSLANSSYYSIPGGVSEIQRALQYLGMQTVLLVVLTSRPGWN